ncbi:MAG: diguanylate cyclase [Planctomycetes bacterium]|nr:diguanylate cyclase [Planctomycetota bacterium]
MVIALNQPDDLLLSHLSTRKSHPRDSSQLLLGLTALSSRSKAPGENGHADEMDGIISKRVLRSLLSTLHFRDVFTVQHSRRVAMVSVGIAEFLGWEGRHLKMIEVASLLHDIGKIGVPDNILFKPGKLSPDEIELMASHRHIGIDILQACRVDHEVLEIVSQSHKFFNGSNNEYKKIGSEVHQGARILAVADAYDSIRTDKPYRKGKSHDEIIEILRKESGNQFDGNIVSALVRWAESDGLVLIQNSDEIIGDLDLQKPTRPEEEIEASIFGHIFSYLYLLESLYDGFSIIDSDLKFILWNSGVEKLLGQSATQMLGRGWTSNVLACADEQGNPLCDQDYPIQRVIASGETASSVFQIQRADQRWIKVELQSVPLLDDQNQLHGVANIFRDLSRSSRRLREYQDLKAAASRDSLTSVANRGELETQLARILSEFSETKNAKPFSLIFIDVDFFKNINDTYGHVVGDQVLIDLVKLLQHETYSGELVGRYGGEEFLILCPETELALAFKRAERLRKAIPDSEIGGSADYHITSSFGVTQVEPGDSVESILRRVDKALYLAKENGRNQSVSLTTQDDLELEANSKLEDECPDDPFVFRTSFFACIAADMVVYKLGGFVNDQKAKVIEVEERHAQVCLGKSRLFWPFWGETDNLQPVELLIKFDAEKQIQQSEGRPASRQVEVHCEVRPIGKVRKRELFEARALRIIKTLRSYFAA